MANVRERGIIHLHKPEGFRRSIDKDIRPCSIEGGAASGVYFRTWGHARIADPRYRAPPLVAWGCRVFKVLGTGLYKSGLGTVCRSTGLGSII